MSGIDGEVELGILERDGMVNGKPLAPWSRLSSVAERLPSLAAVMCRSR
jgi:hypothetical protein